MNLRIGNNSGPRIYRSFRIVVLRTVGGLRFPLPEGWQEDCPFVRTAASEAGQFSRDVSLYSNSSTQNLTSSVTWTSTTSGVATITSAGLATGVAPGNTTIQTTAASINGLAILTVTAVFRWIGYDMWVDFEQCASGSAPTTACLASSTDGTAGTWNVSMMASLITVQTAGQAPKPSGDTGTLGMAYNLANGGEGYVQWTPPSAKSSLSFGLWYKT